jgi:hypothetical protein
LFVYHPEYNLNRLTGWPAINHHPLVQGNHYSPIRFRVYHNFWSFSEENFRKKTFHSISSVNIQCLMKNDSFVCGRALRLKTVHFWPRASLHREFIIQRFFCLRAVLRLELVGNLYFPLSIYTSRDAPVLRRR